MKIQIKIGQQKTIKNCQTKIYISNEEKRTIWYISLLFIFGVIAGKNVTQPTQLFLVT